ncbi:hypothetical protein [Mycolicibacterium nivoides]|uniref:Uncharacterized protein n=1 Tax=Mycolicibacterium nivoides TaxID=2487344 RepID=A0ABW9LL50_9MYCO
METVEAWLAATGADCSDAHRDLLHKALNPLSPEREPLKLPDSNSTDAQAVVALLKKGQVPTTRAVAARAANPANPPVRQPPQAWTTDQIDRFGQLSADWVNNYRLSQASGPSGPTWIELFRSPPLEQIRKQLGIQTGHAGRLDQYRPDIWVLMTGARKRGWLAWSKQPRSLCPGPSFFASDLRPQMSVGRRVAYAIRQFRKANDGQHPTWDNIADAHDAVGNLVFRDIKDAQAQFLWLTTEHWIVVTKSGSIKLGPKAKRMYERNSERNARRHASENSPRTGGVAPYPGAGG